MNLIKSTLLGLFFTLGFVGISLAESTPIHQDMGASGQSFQTYNEVRTPTARVAKSLKSNRVERKAKRKALFSAIKDIKAELKATKGQGMSAKRALILSLIFLGVAILCSLLAYITLFTLFLPLLFWVFAVIFYLLFLTFGIIALIKFLANA